MSTEKMKNLDKNKLKDKLETHLGRPASVAEKANAETDPVLILQVVFDLLDDLTKRVEKLEKP